MPSRFAIRLIVAVAVTIGVVAVVAAGVVVMVDREAGPRGPLTSHRVGHHDDAAGHAPTPTAGAASTRTSS